MNGFKKLVISLSAIALLANPAFSFAQSAYPTVSPRASSFQTERLQYLHNACDTQISKRIDLLNNLLSKVNSLVKLSPSEKSQFSNEIQTDIDNLNRLKTKCDADTTLTSLRTDIGSVYTSLRIYAVFAPQIRILVAADTLDYVDGLMASYSGELQYRLGHQGNPANLTSLLSDMNTKISSAKTEYTNAENIVLTLNPASYPGSIQSLQTARTDIKTGASDLRGAWQDAKQIRQGLKSLGGTSITSSPSPTP